MRSPLRFLTDGFLRTPAVALLLGGVAVSSLQFVGFLRAARAEHVLRIEDGIGFLNNYGLLSTLVGNAVLPWLVRLFYGSIRSFGESRALTRRRVVDEELSRLTAMLHLKGRYRFALYFLLFIGTAFWISNTSVHVFGSAETHWGHKVFDSIDHPIDFALNRLNNLYTWVLVLPWCGYTMTCCTVQLARGLKEGQAHTAVRYDLLNPDQCGGFIAIEHAHIILNVVIAIAYTQITLHMSTFSRMNAEHVIAYVGATLVLLFGNTLFMGSIYQRIRQLRNDALNEYKERVYKNDPLSFEILKFAYKPRPGRFFVIPIVTKAAALAFSAVFKAVPAIHFFLFV